MLLTGKFMTLFAVKLHKVQQFLSNDEFAKQPNEVFNAVKYRSKLAEVTICHLCFFIFFVIVGLDPTISYKTLLQIPVSSTGMTLKTSK